MSNGLGSEGNDRVEINKLSNEAAFTQEAQKKDKSDKDINEPALEI